MNLRPPRSCRTRREDRVAVRLGLCFTPIPAFLPYPTALLWMGWSLSSQVLSPVPDLHWLLPSLGCPGHTPVGGSGSWQSSHSSGWRSSGGEVGGGKVLVPLWQSFLLSPI